MGSIVGLLPMTIGEPSILDIESNTLLETDGREKYVPMRIATAKLSHNAPKHRACVALRRKESSIVIIWWRLVSWPTLELCRRLPSPHWQGLYLDACPHKSYR